MDVPRLSWIHAFTWLIAIPPAAVPADIVTDGSLGPAVQLAGPDMTIGADLGQTRGNNLFHSFQRFNIPTDQRATFNGPSHIQNVVGRVTGGEVSRIDGTLRSTVGQADVYLINPSGVVMGPNAKVDVPAALHLGTADELRFSDGSRFSARDANASTLTSAPPEAFGFLTPQPANLSLDGAQLDLKPGQNATLTAGDIALAGTAERPARITASGGHVRLEAVGNAQAHIPVNQPSSQSAAGHVQLDHAEIDISGENAGRLTMRAGSATLTQESALDAAHGGTSAAAGGIDLAIADDLRMSEGSRITADALGEGRGGAINVAAGALTLSDGARISADAAEGGDTGTIAVQADALSLSGEGSVIGTSSWIDHRPDAGAAGDVNATVNGLLWLSDGAAIRSSSLVGDAGTLSVRAGDLFLEGADTAIATSALGAGEFGSGKAGALIVEVAGLLELRDGAIIENSTLIGEAGDLAVSAGELRMVGGLNRIYTAAWGTGSPNTPGQASAMMIQVDGLMELRDQAKIASFSNVSGDAGTVSVRADNLRMLGTSLGDNFGVMISSHAEPGSAGYAGDVQIVVGGRLEMEDAMISSLAKGSGEGGMIDIRAHDLLMGTSPELGDGDTMQMILTQVQPEASGNAGDIHLEMTGIVELNGQSWISSTSLTSGNAGNIVIRASELRIDGQFGADNAAGIFGDVDKDLYGLDHGVTGQIGSIDIQADRVSIVNDGIININANHSMDTPVADHIDSRIYIDALSLELDGGYIEAETNSPVTAAAIQIQADQLHLTNGAQIDTSTRGQGHAGSIRLDTSDLRLDGSGSLISSRTLSQAGGRAGNITITAQNLALLNGGEISIDADQTLPADRLEPMSSGQITLTADDLILDGGTLSARSRGNVPASAILIRPREMRLTDSTITTESLEADAGPIHLQGGLTWLTNSQITTSVNGFAGDGGDITLGVDYLILDGGFIQANTAATGAHGGDILIETRAIVANQNQLTVGGTERQSMDSSRGHNVIQAAAPGGEQGNIRVTAPTFDITASLVPLATPFQDPDALLADLCGTVSGPRANSLVERGLGGLAPGPDTPTSTFFVGERLERIQDHSSGQRGAK